ncbi:MAG: family tricarboxylate transporter, receptor protein [Hyphomicrobiales bacterium]|nr:family tricarboxylate transporter, receptor protein [Hyphomicrobiales bacterium]
MRPRGRIAFAVATALACGLASAGPGRAEDIYANKTVTLILGYAPGGGVDIAGRVIARHFGRFTPGAPAILVQNMPGASGLLAANHMAHRAAPNGLTIAIPGRSWHVEGLIKSRGADFDPAKMTYLGSTGTVNAMAWVRGDTGVSDEAALKRAAAPVTFGALGPGTPTAMVPVLMKMAGLPVRIVTGYPSASNLLIALERGEVQAAFLTADSFSARQDLISRKIVAPVVQTKPDIPGLPIARDLLPADLRPLYDLARSSDSLGLMMIAPPGTPDGPREVLRKAFMDMAHDAAYQADAAKVESTRAQPLDGAQIARMIDALAAATTPDVIAAYERLKDASLR